MSRQIVDERTRMTRHPELVVELAAGGRMPAQDSFTLLEPPRRETPPQGRVGQVVLFAARNVTWHSRSGRLIFADGSQAASIAGQEAKRDRSGPRLRLKRASLWLTPPGARANYGHYIFDAMSSLCFLEESGISLSFQPLRHAFHPGRKACWRLRNCGRGGRGGFDRRLSRSRRWSGRAA